jgi:glutathione S-transferase
MPAVLYAIPASHPCAAVERALQLKELPYRRVDLIPVAHRLVGRAGFGATSVPRVAFDDGKRIAGSRAIIRELEERAPDPPLLPADRDARAGVARAEEWGDQVLQPLTRRLIWATVARATDAVMSYTDGARLPIPAPAARLSAPFVAHMARRLNGATDPAVRADLIALPSHLSRVDRWVEDGTLGGGAVNAADLQIGASLRLMLTVGDVAPEVDSRPAGALARRVFPAYPGHVPAGALPPAWLAGLANGGR